MCYYILGLLFTDGNLDKSKSKLTLSLTEKELIEKLYPYFSDTKKRKIYYSNDTNTNHAPSYAIINSNSKVIEKVENIGIKPNKTLGLDFPELDSLTKKISFMRGVFDGDGSVYKQVTRSNNKEYCYTNISFTSGSEKFANGMMIYLSEMGIKSTLFVDKRKTKKNYTYYVYIRKKEYVKKFFDLIYNNPNSIYMKRKYLKYLKI